MAKYIIAEGTITNLVKYIIQAIIDGKTKALQKSIVEDPELSACVDDTDKSISKLKVYLQNMKDISNVNK